jgi:hypothetical protein
LHLFDPLKEALGEKRFGANDEVELFLCNWWLDEKLQTFSWKGHNEATVYTGAGRICGKTGITFCKMWLIMFWYKKSVLYLNSLVVNSRIVFKFLK